ncbi:unnamed protein product, partial [Mesorhabditis belari]|uniref:Serpin domain-containing protein n=1 Tax=Mesorhabditis belari TaxID=2138241 RepID=A0AAF3J2C1_9BILA
MSLDFTVRLLRENNKKRSTVFSPAALGCALATVHYGADGWTQRELNDILFRGHSPCDVTKFYTDIAVEICQENPNIKAKMMNHLLLRKEFQVNKKWQSEVGSRFGATVETGNFKAAHELAREIVSASNFSTPKNLTSILINCASFKGLWPRGYYKPRFFDFYGDNETRKVLFLQKTLNNTLCNFSQAGVQVVGISFKDYNYKLWMFLPDKQEFWISLKEWIDSLNATYLEYLIEGAEWKACHVKFPKFKTENHIPTKRNLQNLKLNQIFTERARLEKICHPSTYITDIVHKCHVEIDEEGAEPVVVQHHAYSGSRLTNVRVNPSCGGGGPRCLRYDQDGQGQFNDHSKENSPTPFINSDTNAPIFVPRTLTPAASKVSMKAPKIPIALLGNWVNTQPKPAQNGTTPQPTKPFKSTQPVQSFQPQKSKQRFGPYRPPIEEFIADHPFMYLITFRDKVLFTGTYY